MLDKKANQDLVLVFIEVVLSALLGYVFLESGEALILALWFIAALLVAYYYLH